MVVGPGLVSPQHQLVVNGGCSSAGIGLDHNQIIKKLVGKTCMILHISLTERVASCMVHWKQVQQMP